MRPALVPAMATAGAVVVADQLTKALVLATIEPGETVPIVGTIRLLRAMNRGVAFSVGDTVGVIPYLVAAAVTVLTVGVGVAVSRPSSHPSVLRPRVGILLGALVGGGWGNYIDRLFRTPGRLHGPVVDFIDVGPFPVFNVADSALTVAVAVMLLASLRSNRQQQERP